MEDVTKDIFVNHTALLYLPLPQMRLLRRTNLHCDYDDGHVKEDTPKAKPAGTMG